MFVCQQGREQTNWCVYKQPKMRKKKLPHRHSNSHSSDFCLQNCQVWIRHPSCCVAETCLKEDGIDGIEWMRLMMMMMMMMMMDKWWWCEAERWQLFVSALLVTYYTRCWIWWISALIIIIITLRCHHCRRLQSSSRHIREFDTRLLWKEVSNTICWTMSAYTHASCGLGSFLVRIDSGAFCKTRLTLFVCQVS